MLIEQDTDNVFANAHIGLINLFCQKLFQDQRIDFEAGAPNHGKHNNLETVQADQHQRFDVLPSGLHERGGERLDPELLRALLHKLSADYRFVVIDGEAVYAGADSLVMSPLVDGVILVINANDTRREVAQAASQRLSLAGARLVGSVFNRRRYYMPTWLYNHL